MGDQEPPSYRQVLEAQIAKLENIVAGFEHTRNNVCEQLEIYKNGISPAAVEQVRQQLAQEAIGACPPTMVPHALAAMSPEARELIRHHHFIQQLDEYRRFPNQEIQRLRAELSTVFPASSGVPQDSVNVAGAAEVWPEPIPPVIHPPYVAPSTDDVDQMARLYNFWQAPEPPLVVHVDPDMEHPGRVDTPEIKHPIEMKHAWEVEDFNRKADNAGDAVTGSLVKFLIGALAGAAVNSKNLGWNGKHIRQLKGFDKLDTETIKLALELDKLSAAHRVDTKIAGMMALGQIEARRAASAAKAARAANPENPGSGLAMPNPKLRPQMADAVPIPDAASPRSGPVLVAQPAVIAQPRHEANADVKKSKLLRNCLKAEIASPYAVEALADFVAEKMKGPPLKGKEPASIGFWTALQGLQGFKSLAQDAQKLAELMVQMDSPAERIQTQVLVRVLAGIRLDLLEQNCLESWDELYDFKDAFDRDICQDPVALSAVRALAQAEAPRTNDKKEGPEQAGLEGLSPRFKQLVILAFAWGKAEVEFADFEMAAKRVNPDLEWAPSKMYLVIPAPLRSQAMLASSRLQQLQGSSADERDGHARLFNAAAKDLESALLQYLDSSRPAAAIRTVPGIDRAAIKERSSD